jgi:hypothetical protein
MKNDGGAAYPWGNKSDGGDTGMTLRDYMAGQALVGLLSHYGRDSLDQMTGHVCYKLADSMIEARGE